MNPPLPPQVSYNRSTIYQRRMYGSLRARSFIGVWFTVSPAGALLVQLGPGSLPDEVKLLGWAPQPHWKLGVGGRCSDPPGYAPPPSSSACAAPENAQWVDNLVVISDALLQSTSLQLAVGLNGQQFFGDYQFAYSALSSAVGITPMHGPAAGGSDIVLTGANLGTGAPHESACRFGSTSLGWTVTRATQTTGGRLRCITPTAHHGVSTGLAVHVHVSTNAQQFAAAGAGFTFYPHPVVAQLTPSSGPLEGGTLVRVYGSHLGGGSGSTRLCRLGMGGAAVPATFDGVSGALLCFTSPGEGVVAEQPLQVSLNGVDFTTAVLPRFSLYLPPHPQTAEPSAGFSNGTEVSINGTALWREGMAGWREGASCRFGHALTNASQGVGGSIRCVAPPAAQAGSWSRLSLDFQEPWIGGLFEGELRLLGSAMIQGGVLILTNATAPHVASYGARGSLVAALPQPARAPTYFRATFKLRMGGGSGADGFSFSYGDLPAGAIGEMGAGAGLRVCWRTHTHERLEVWYASHLLHVAVPPEGSSLRRSTFVPIIVEYKRDGLSISHAAAGLSVSALRIGGWAPREGWRFGFGSRVGGDSDDHHLDDLLLEAGSAVEPEPVPLELTFNQLQYSSSGLMFTYLPESALEAGVTQAD